MSAFPETSLTLIAKIRDLPPGQDNAAWVRFGGHLIIGRYNCINNGSEIRCDESVTVG